MDNGFREGEKFANTEVRETIEYTIPVFRDKLWEPEWKQWLREQRRQMTKQYLRR